MSLYADDNYYMNVYLGNTIDPKEIKRHLKIAQEKIDSITHNRIVRIGFEKLTEFQKQKIKEAVCAQADYIYENGYNNENNSDVLSYKVLDISVNMDNSNKTKTTADELGMSNYAYDCLLKTGLATNGWRF